MLVQVLLLLIFRATSQATPERSRRLRPSPTASLRRSILRSCPPRARSNISPPPRVRRARRDVTVFLGLRRPSLTTSRAFPRLARRHTALARRRRAPTNEETLAVDHKKITCPTAVFWALHDAWMPKESGERLKQDIAGPVRLQFIERAGHWSQEDRPDEVAALIEDFITEWEGINI